MFDQHGVTKLNSFKAETIYRNETAMAFGASQFAKLQTVSDRFPYWQYTTAHDERVRESHRLLDGKIFLAGDSEYYPPLGFNCRCTVIPISLRQAETRGITKPDTVTPEMRANLANAEFIGDKVGNFADWLQVKMAELPESTQALITEKLAEITASSAEQIQSIPLELINKNRLVEVNAKSTDIDYINTFLAEFNTSIGSAVTYTDVTGIDIIINEDLFINRVDQSFKVGKGRKKYIKVLADALKDPDEIWTTVVGKQEKRVYLKMLQKDNGDQTGAIIVFKDVNDNIVGSTGFVTTDLKYLEKQRVGTRVYKK